MGKVKSLKNSFFRSRVNGKSLHKKTGNGNGKKSVSSHKVLFEPMEPRVLMWSDLTYCSNAAFDLTLRLNETSPKPQLINLVAVN